MRRPASAAHRLALATQRLASAAQAVFHRPQLVRKMHSRTTSSRGTPQCIHFLKPASFVFETSSESQQQKRIRRFQRLCRSAHQRGGLASAPVAIPSLSAGWAFGSLLGASRTSVR